MRQAGLHWRLSEGVAILDSARVAQPPTSWLSTTRSLKRLSRETVAASTDASSLGVSERTTAAPGPGAEAILMMLAVGWKSSSLELSRSHR